MASTLKHLRSSTADKRPTASGLADGQLAINTASGTPGLYFKDSNGGVVKVGPVHIGATAPNATPAGSAGNSLGEQWLDSAGGGYRAKYWDGSAWRSPIITNADIGTSAAIALSKLATGALPSGITVASSNIVDGTIVDADISASAAIGLSKLATGALPSGITIASSNIVDGSIVNADVASGAAIAGTKISPDFGGQNITTTGTATVASLTPTSNSVPTNGLYLPGANSLGLSTNGVQRVRIDDSGRFLVGTSAGRSTHTIEGTNFATSSLVLATNQNTQDMPFLQFVKSRGGSVNSVAAVQEGDYTGAIEFIGTDGSTASTKTAGIYSQVDGVPGTNDMPGRLVFSTTADGSASTTERARINSSGYFKVSNNGTYQNSAGSFHEFRQTATADNVYLTSTNASFASTSIGSSVTRAASAAYFFLLCWSNGVSDLEFNLRGDGQAFADGSWTGGGADYAEYFEWNDGNQNNEDRRGVSVVLDGDKIREAQAGEEPIGVISANPSVVGDAAWNKWSGKYLRDDFNSYVMEDYEVKDENGNTVIQQRRKLNPAYNPDQEYIPRGQRPEWSCVGLMGKLRIRKGQVTGSRWIKMRDVSDSVEEWLVR